MRALGELVKVGDQVPWWRELVGGGEGDEDDAGKGVLGRHGLFLGGEENDGEAVGVGPF